MIVIYAHCRLKCYDIVRSMNDPLYYDHPELPWHVTKALEIFKDHKIYFYTTNPATPLDQVQATEKYLVEMTSYDFGQYRKGVLNVLSQGLDENIIIMNDGCFLIPENIDRLFSEWIKYDIMGITYNGSHDPPHLQSYFILFTRKVVNDPRFRVFWEHHIQDGWDKGTTIHQGECALTPYFVNMGYKIGYFCRFNVWNGGWHNPSCMRQRTPVLKIKQNESEYRKYQLA